MGLRFALMASDLPICPLVCSYAPQVCTGETGVFSHTPRFAPTGLRFALTSLRFALVLWRHYCLPWISASQLYTLQGYLTYKKTHPPS